jgi:hypothetical protein
MKKMFLMLATAGTMMAGLASCTKEDTPAPAITQTENVSLRVGESYTFTLPKNLRDDPYEITTPAQHASVSELGVNSSGDRIYSYTPAAGYSGTDQVVVSNDQEREEHHPHPQGPPPGGPHSGSCSNSGPEDHYIITINFVMKGSDITVSK